MADLDVPQWVPDEPDEDDSERDGVLSYAKEPHALVLGLGAGFAAALTGNVELAAAVVAVALGARAAPTRRLKQLVVEPWYAIGGVLIGYVVGGLF